MWPSTSVHRPFKITVDGDEIKACGEHELNTGARFVGVPNILGKGWGRESACREGIADEHSTTRDWGVLTSVTARRETHSLFNCTSLIRMLSCKLRSPTSTARVGSSSTFGCGVSAAGFAADICSLPLSCLGGTCTQGNA